MANCHIKYGKDNSMNILGISVPSRGDPGSSQDHPYTLSSVGGR